MKKSSSTEGELKKSVAYEKACNTVAVQGSFSDIATTNIDFTNEAVVTFPSLM